MSGLMTVTEIAQRLGLDRSCILKKVRQRRLAITKVQGDTARSRCYAISDAEGIAIIREYEIARSLQAKTTKSCAVCGIEKDRSDFRNGRLCKRCSNRRGGERQAEKAGRIYNPNYQKRGRKPCKIGGCPHLAHGDGYCTTHISRLRKGQPLDSPIPKRLEVGDERLVAGYLCVYLPDDPRANKVGNVSKARIVHEQVTGDTLRQGETVRFRDNDQNNLRLANMYINGRGSRIGQCAFCHQPYTYRLSAKNRKTCSRSCAGKMRMQSGEKNQQAKLTNLTVLNVRTLLAVGYSRKRLARLLCVSRPCINKIALGKSFQNVPCFNRKGSLDDYLMEAAAFRSRIVNQSKRSQCVENRANRPRTTKGSQLPR